MNEIDYSGVHITYNKRYKFTTQGRLTSYYIYPIVPVPNTLLSYVQLEHCNPTFNILHAISLSV